MNLSAPPPRRSPRLGRTRHVHLVGIGGVGMSGIAEILLNQGFLVSGSDLRHSELTERLERLGARIFEGHAPEHVHGADVVVYSSAVRPEENPETLEAHRLRIPVIRRAEMLAELMRMKYGIGVAGTHGKTTTTSMVGLVVAAGGYDPTIIVGGRVHVFGSNAVPGAGDVIVVEADEYDRTFLQLSPTLAVLTTLDLEHTDVYASLEDLEQAFCAFANKVPFYGSIILCLDDPNLQRLLAHLERRVVTYGFSPQARLRAVGVELEQWGSTFTVSEEQRPLGRVRLAVPGRHNVQNALAAVAVGLELEVDFPRIAEALAAFTGVERRFHLRGEHGGVIWIDDYAHHPAEVRATLETARSGWPGCRLVAVFQPHLYSRTRDLYEDFARAFLEADLLVVLDVYPAREHPIAGVSGALIAEAARRLGHRHVHYIADKAALAERLPELLASGDLLLSLGAGDVHRFVEKAWAQWTKA
ncbi:MAG: UDP-N-acetylmuramate--L-alanine ligase [Bacteroidetes bacterium]|nr:UDP-N-acetylmuramate--L-alanine ligase [Rhodothermia bacterium]MCS7155869.1 UDP-N-acetylmuramate--L-alanine ligase [Bacteroidota bacterium]MCX7906030.1 UDP-N-acetylmuramate--L-alanine ligase [Bacteroidota bacterium]MDW8138158.1 UDP-N-acetylmuramate--L-alanine ligase [Bacteroidota bacterium]MDW8285842.1 UDP-N-acetylmuramate--L-alanine ligase [Bacteroidota bacterium]